SLRPLPSDPPATPHRPCAGRASTRHARQPGRFAAALKARAGSRAAKRGRYSRPLPEGRDLRQEIGLVDGLDDVIASALPHAPDLVGLLALAGAQDDGNALGGLVAAQRARRLETVLTRQHD